MGNETKTRTEQVGIRLQPAERELVEAAARRDQRTVSDWIRIVATRAARRLLRRKAA